jgi:hypothetical protein
MITSTVTPFEVTHSEHGHWELRRPTLNGSETIYPFATAALAVKHAVENNLPFYELD